MKLYGFPLSPFVRKTLVAIKEKGLDTEVVPSNPQQPDEEFAAVSPFHKIPAFRDGDFTIADSTAIVTYLDA
jgi:glutathione S-transferase